MGWVAGEREREEGPLSVLLCDGDSASDGKGASVLGLCPLCQCCSIPDCPWHLLSGRCVGGADYIFGPKGLALGEASLRGDTANFPFCRPVSVPLNTAGVPVCHSSAITVNL